MDKDLTVQSERVDDTPLLLAHMEKMEVISLLDECFSMHGNWQGLSLGEVAAGWLAHILSEGDHRMNRYFIDKRRTITRSTKNSE